MAASKKLIRWDYRWLAVLAGIGCNFIGSGFFRSGGIIYSATLQYFGATRTEAAWIPILNAIIVFMTAPISTTLAKRFSFHAVISLGTILSIVGVLFCYFARSTAWLFVGWSFFFGFGMSAIMFPAITAGGVYFAKGRPLAVSLILIGGPIGSFCLPPILQILLEEYSFRGALLLIAGVSMHVFIFALLLYVVHQEAERKKINRKQSKNETEEPMLKENVSKENGHQKLSVTELKDFKDVNLTMENDKDVIKIKVEYKTQNIAEEPKPDGFRTLVNDVVFLLKQSLFLLNALSGSLHATVFIGLLTAFKDYSVHELGTTGLEGAYLISATAVADLLTRLVVGIIFTKYKPRKDITIVCAMCVSIGCLLSIAILRTYEVAMFFGVIAGICYAIALMLYFEIYASNFKPKYLLAVGLGETTKASVFVLMGVLVGKLKDATGSYRATFLSFAGMDAFAAFLWFLYLCCKKGKRTVY